MTAVLFKFSNPDGTPVANAPFLVTTRKASFDETLHSGIQVPGDINAVTDAQGEATVTLLAGFATYYLLMDSPGAVPDSSGCITGLRYRFVVSESATPLRVEDLIVTTPTWSRPWDETALQIIIDAKAVSQASAVAAKASEDAAGVFADQAESAVAATLVNAQTATAAAATATSASGTATQARNEALGFRDQAGTNAAAAAASATAADTSKVAAAASASEALASQTSATGSAATATAQAAIATTKAGEAAASAAAALADKNTTIAARDVTTAARDVTLGYRDEAETARDEAVAAAGVFSGGLVEAGDISLAGGAYPAAPTYSSIWQVNGAGTVSGTAYAVGDNLVYSKTLGVFYKIDNTDAVPSVAGRTGPIVLTKADVGLSAVDNTSDANKPVSTAQATSIATKQASSTNLTALASVAAAADRVPIFTGATAASYLPAGTSGKALLAASTADAAQTALGATAVGKALLIAANAAAGRAALTLGTAATEDVTVSSVDGTVGRILRVGDYGLGQSSSVTVDPSLLDSTSLLGGMYRIDIPSGGLKGLPAAPYALFVNRLNNGVAVGQIAINYTTGQMYVRANTTANFNLLYGQSNTVGTVSQSGGVPTGAIIERGTNVNGEFVKLADGTLICWFAGPTALPHTANTDLVTNWTLPFPSIALNTGIPTVAVRSPSTTNIFVSNKLQSGMASVSEAQFRTNFTVAQNYILYFNFIGRWF